MVHAHAFTTLECVPRELLLAEAAGCHARLRGRMAGLQRAHHLDRLHACTLNHNPTHL